MDDKQKKAESALYAMCVWLVEGLLLWLVWNYVVTALWMQAPFISVIQAIGLIILRQVVLKR